MKLKLYIHLPGEATRVVDFATFTSPCVVGRDAEVAQLVIGDSQASRAHCSISIDRDLVHVEDMGSRNGSWLNGQRMTRGRIYHGDAVRIGRTHIMFEVGDNPPLQSPIGQRLGGFDLQEVIGRGRYGTVFRGLQVTLGRPVAVKVLAEEFRSVPESVQEFLTEARRAGRLNHPNLVQVHDVYQVDKDYLLIMELMKGSTADLLRDQGTLDEITVLNILAQTASALAYAESQRLVHRDVKPDNILFNDAGIYKLADLGIAAPIAENGVALQERIFGSPHYVAPEQARGGAIDGHADIYALGATAFHLLTGKTVFSGTNRQIVVAHMNTPAPDLGELAPNLSPGIVELVMEMLEKDPDDRPESAEDVAKRAEELSKHPPKARVKTVRKRAKRIRRRRYR